jgi:hypothetical protein
MLKDFLRSACAGLRFTMLNGELLATDEQSGIAMWVKSTAFERWLLARFNAYYQRSECSNATMRRMILAIEQLGGVQAVKATLLREKLRDARPQGFVRSPIGMGIERRLRMFRSSPATSRARRMVALSPKGWAAIHLAINPPIPS